MQLVQRDGFWIRAECAEPDMVIVRDVYQNDAYRLSLIPGVVAEAELVVDVGAHIGCFAKLVHERNPLAKIVCIEANADNVEALRANVGDFATILHGACTYDTGKVRLLNSVYPGCANTGGSHVVPVGYDDAGKIIDPDYPYNGPAYELTKYTLEDVMRLAGATRIDVLKLDCEWSEYSVLTTSNLSRIRFVVGEYHGKSHWEAFRARFFRGWDYGHMYDGGESTGLFHYRNPVWPPKGAELIWRDRLTVAVPPGIGDALWALTKAPAVLEYHGRDRLDVAILGGNDRALEFVRRFDFVDRAYVVNRPCEASDDVSGGLFDYLPSGRDAARVFDWLLIPNGHLERGRRLEDWLIELPIDWTIAARFRLYADEAREATRIRRELGRYVVCYLGPLSGNTVAGHNRGGLWSEADWRATFRAIHSVGCVPVLIGTEADRAYSEAIAPPEVVNLVGNTSIGTALGIVQQAEAAIGYQGGVVMFAAYVGVPTAIFWRPHGNSILPDRHVSFDERMSTAWIPPAMVDRCLSAIYARTTPADVAAWLARECDA